MNRIATAVAIILAGASMTACSPSIEDTVVSNVPAATAVKINDNSATRKTLKAFFSSGPRQDQLQGALHYVGQELFKKILDEGIPYELLTLNEKQLDPAEPVPTPAKAPDNGWGKLVTKGSTDILGTDACVSLIVSIRDGKVNRSVGPLYVHIRGEGSSLSFGGKDVAVRTGEVLHFPESAYSWQWRNASDDLHGVMAVTENGTWPPTDTTVSWDVQVYEDQGAYANPDIDRIKRLDSEFVNRVIPAFLATVDSSDWTE